MTTKLTTTRVTSHRILVANDPASAPAAAAVLAAGDAAFPELALRDSEPFLPKLPRRARCRLCGNVRVLNREHIPPKKAFNAGRSRSHTFDEYLRRGPDGVMPGGVQEQGGIWGYTLCPTCNSFTGSRYADEYRLWAGSIVDSIRRAGVDVKTLEASTVQPRGHVTLAGKPRPGAFLREVLAMMVSLSGGFDMAGRYPAIRRLVLDGSVEPLPDGVSVGLTGFLGGYPRLVGPQVVGGTDGLWQVIMEIAVPPLATLMVLGGTRPAAHVFDLSPFALIDPDWTQDVDADLDVGFGATVYPGDYRTPGMLAASLPEGS